MKSWIMFLLNSPVLLLKYSVYIKYTRDIENCIKKWYKMLLTTNTEAEQ